MSGRTGLAERGFTFIEVLTAAALIAVLMALAMPAVRQFWFVQSLDAAEDQLISEMRGLQSRVTSESHPLVYGIRFTDSGNWNATGKWGLVKYDPQGSATGPTCRQFATGTFDPGAFGAVPSIVGPSFTGSEPTGEQAFCRQHLRDASGTIAIPAAGDEFAFFYARGSATAGTLRLDHPNLDPTRDITLRVSALTGRIQRQ